MSENTPTSSKFPASWEEGCVEIREALKRLEQGYDPEPLERLIQGTVAAAYCHGVVFLNPNFSNSRKPDLDSTEHADARYLEAKAKAVVRDTQEAQQAVREAFDGGGRDTVTQALRDLVAESAEQAQVNWYQRSKDRSYRGLTRRMVDGTLEELFKEVGLSHPS